MVSVFFLSWTYPLGYVFALKFSSFLSFETIMRNKWRVTKSINRHRPEEKKTSCLFAIFPLSLRLTVYFLVVTQHNQIQVSVKMKKHLTHRSEFAVSFLDNCAFKSDDRFRQMEVSEFVDGRSFSRVVLIDGVGSKGVEVWSSSKVNPRSSFSNQLLDTSIWCINLCL